MTPSVKARTSEPIPPRKRLTLWVYGFALILLSLGLAAGLSYSQAINPSISMPAALALGIAWANSSFDPAQNSRAHRIWQYAAPWVVGGMGFLGGPIGLFLGALGGSALAGFFTGVSFGMVLSGALLFVGCIVIFAVYSYCNYRDYRKLYLSSQQDDSSFSPSSAACPNVKDDASDPDDSGFDFHSSIVSLFLSFLQGVAIAGTLVIGVKVAGGLGLFLAFLWNLTLVLSVMTFHLVVRGQLRRMKRFLLLFSTVSGGALLGVVLGTSLS